jgi:hypothetical protein
MADEAPLKLRARDSEDLTVISSMLQDALIPLGDMTYLPDEKSFVMAVNRFRWEKANGPRERIVSGLRFDAVRNVRYRGIDRGNRGQFLSFLVMYYTPDPAGDGGAVTIGFSGGGAIRIDVGGLYAALGDLGEAWPTLWTPEHDTD